MADPQNTVFISYRRSVSWATARAIFMDLRANGYDVFMDVANLDCGTFDTIILNQIAARAYFLVILEPKTVDRCAEPGDWLRREIEYAMDLGRNIVPVMVDPFKLDDQTLKCLTGKLGALPRYNALPLYPYYFEDAMKKLRENFLRQPIYGPIIPTPRDEEAIVQQTIDEIIEQPEPIISLSEKEYLDRGIACQRRSDLEGAIFNFNEAIRLNPQYAHAYNNRGIAYRCRGDFARAIVDHNTAIRLNTRYADAYVCRGMVHDEQGNPDKAISDYTKAIQINPHHADAYNNRGWAYEQKGKFTFALGDYDAALQINPQHELARQNRADLLKKLGRF